VIFPARQPRVTVGNIGRGARRENASSNSDIYLHARSYKRRRPTPISIDLSPISNRKRSIELCWRRTTTGRQPRQRYLSTFIPYRPLSVCSLLNFLFESCTGMQCVKPRLHQDTCCRTKVYPLVAVNMFLVSATKLLPVPCPSVAGYKGIQVDRDIINE